MPDTTASQPKKKLEVIPRKVKGKIDPLYELLDELVAGHAEHLEGAKIALAWRWGWKPDPDGQLQLGKAHKANELGHQLHGFDFAITLNKDVWDDTEFDEKQRSALLLHEVCHCGVTRDSHGEIACDEGGRPHWRIVKHDVEEFQLVVDTFGAWREELRTLAKATRETADQPLLAAPKGKKRKGAAA